MFLTLAFQSKHASRLPRSFYPLALTLPRSFSFTPRRLDAQGQGTKVIQPTLGVAAALKAKSDPSFQPKVQIFDEFALKDGVAVVSKLYRLLYIACTI